MFSLLTEGIHNITNCYCIVAIPKDFSSNIVQYFGIDKKIPKNSAYSFI